jgi:hypothetical protein
MELMTSTQWKVIALSFLAKEPINIYASKKVSPNDRLTTQDCDKKKEQIQVQENSDCEEKSTDFPVIEIGI